jgi:hypothetical protein
MTPSTQAQLGEDEAALRVTQQILQLVYAGRRVGGHDDDPALGRAEPQIKKLETVAKMQIDSIAGLETKLQKIVGHTVGGGIELLVA